MIITKLQGGIGNQIFQYAAGRKLATSINADLKLDTSWYDSVDKSYREFKLSSFNISGEIASREEIFKFKKRGLAKIFRKLFPSKKWATINEKDLIYDNAGLHQGINIYLDGYWQGEKYFSGIENLIKQEITLKNQPTDQAENIIKEIEACNSVSLHIRRGDYLTEKFKVAHPLCSPEYYQQTAEILKNKLENPALFIFSDDIEWAKKNLKFTLPMIFVSQIGMRDVEELILMSKCKHNIIANSSFSWWGAWLNNNPNKIVIAPKKWFNNQEKNNKDLIPPTWIKI